MNKFLGLLFALLPLSAWAQDFPVQPIPPEASAPAKTVGLWEIFIYEYDQGRVCYMAIAPSRTDGIDKKERRERGKAMLTITNRTARDEWSVTSVSAGFKIKADEPVYININGLNYDLFASGESAWTKDYAADRTIQLIMPAVRSVEARMVRESDGRKVVDFYPMKDFLAAKKEIDTACDAPNRQS